MRRVNHQRGIIDEPLVRASEMSVEADQGREETDIGNRQLRAKKKPAIRQKPLQRLNNGENRADGAIVAVLPARLTALKRPSDTDALTGVAAHNVIADESELMS